MPVITSMRTLEDVVAETAPRVVLRVLGAFAAAAFSRHRHPRIACIYGPGPFARDRRPHRARCEAGDIVAMVLGRSAMLAVVGVGIGAAIAYAAGRSMQAMLFGVDPPTQPCSPPPCRRAGDDAGRQPAPRLARGPN